ncbi:MAG: hypothetical protein M3067_03025 [Chloroflexota bacterium]|nr:hypothetical protein [Chloroflexota bacterium]
MATLIVFSGGAAAVVSESVEEAFDKINAAGGGFAQLTFVYEGPVHVRTDQIGFVRAETDAEEVQRTSPHLVR